MTGALTLRPPPRRRYITCWLCTDKRDAVHPSVGPHRWFRESGEESRGGRRLCVRGRVNICLPVCRLLIGCRSSQTQAYCEWWVSNSPFFREREILLLHTVLEKHPPFLHPYLRLEGGGDKQNALSIFNLSTAPFFSLWFKMLVFDYSEGAGFKWRRCRRRRLHFWALSHGWERKEKTFSRFSESDPSCLQLFNTKRKGSFLNLCISWLELFSPRDSRAPQRFHHADPSVGNRCIKPNLKWTVEPCFSHFNFNFKGAVSSIYYFF